MIECNHNCLECPYPDVPDECLEAALTWAEYKELDTIDKDIINPKTAKQKAVAAQKKAYREANKDRLAARQKCIALVRKAQGMTQNGLAAIVQLLRKEIERVGGFAFVRVASHDRVCVSTSYQADMSRDTLYTATADVPGFRGGWRDQEQAVIELRSLFIPGEGTRYLLDLLSRMSKDSGVTTKDNGVSQTVEVKAGVSLKQNVEINPRVKLQPFRTFLEVAQPESEYLLRVDEDGRIGLFEADGGVWKLEAKRNVKEYLAVELDDLVKSGQVVVMM